MAGEWTPVNPERDFTHQARLEGLSPATHYAVLVECRAPDGTPGPSLTAHFATAPAAADPRDVSFTVVTGQDFARRDDPVNGHNIYDAMLKMKPNFFVHTGDIVYYDKVSPYAHSVALARHKWNCLYALPFQRAFHNEVASYFIKDDHDTWQNDCWPAMQNDLMRDFTFAQGQAVFLEQVPMGEHTWRTFRWGKDLQIWLPEGRDFRSPNNQPDGPDKTIWGEKQKAWFKETVQASDATFRILISPTPLVGPDRGTKNDNHANRGFTHEGDELRKFISAQSNMIVICGDRHWQYVSEDPDTGLREYCSGPTSNVHAGGFSEDQREPMHRYLNIVGGFLSAALEHPDGMPRLTLRHHDVHGAVLHEEVHQTR
ncbi:MAG: alkaline phosphatase D family protein [Candidatus Hydrogenedentes bacterium]|nr:alkaline phosphatase D family protein [Candidatus Hydrogenedentota bacterium]